MSEQHWTTTRGSIITLDGTHLSIQTIRKDLSCYDLATIGFDRIEQRYTLDNEFFIRLYPNGFISEYINLGRYATEKESASLAEAILRCVAKLKEEDWNKNG